MGRSSAYDFVMRRAPRVATARFRVLLTASTGVALAVVLPALVAAGAGAPSASVTVLSLALAALLVLVRAYWVSPARCSRVSARLVGGGGPPVLSGRVTDRVHHPLRPRAPGLA